MDQRDGRPAEPADFEEDMLNEDNEDDAEAGHAANGASTHCAVALYSTNTAVGFAWLHPSRHMIECGEVLAKLPSLADVTGHSHAPAQLSLQDLPSQFRWLQLTMQELQPRVVISPSKGCPRLTALLGAISVAPTLQPPAEFSAAKCREQMKFLWPEASALSWASRLNLANEAMLLALSALLSHIIRTGLAVFDIQEVAPVSVMHVERSTLRSLQVFSEERHPAAALGIGAAKEALSLFSLLCRPQSAAGRQTLRQWCSLPLADPAATSARHDAVEFFVAHADLTKQILACLRMFRHPGRLIRKIQTLSHGPREYKLLEQTCCAVVELVRIVETSAVRGEMLQMPAVRRLLERIHVEPLQLMAHAIRRTVDLSAVQSGAKAAGAWKGSRTAAILSGVDAQLDELRLYVSGMDTFLTAAAQRIVNALPPFYHCIPMSVVFFPSLGYLVAIDTRSSGAAFSLRSGDGLPTGWELSFATEECLYCKNDEVRELDQSVGDVHASIVERMAEVQRALDEQLLGLAPHLLQLQDCGEVECLVAFAAVALEERWVRPTMCPDPVLDLVNAFHPLLSRASAKHVVPFSFAAGLNKRVCIVSGANGSGKSVFVRSVPLIVFMAHIGCFVPCSSATIGTFDQLFLDSGDSSAAPVFSSGPPVAPELASTFGGELCLVSRFIAQASQRTVIMLDEFGKGTLANDGIALLAGIIDHFISLGSQGPLVLLTTHFTEIFAKRLVNISLVQRLHMKVVACVQRPIDLTADGAAATAPTTDETPLSYLYQPERCDTVSVLSSHAFHCAIAACVPPVVANRALVISRRLSIGVPPSNTRGGRGVGHSTGAELLSLFMQAPIAQDGGAALDDLRRAFEAAGYLATDCSSGLQSG